MKIIQVTYTTKDEYSEKNQANIKNVMADLHRIGHPGINYNACLKDDGKTFIHTVFFNSEEDQKVLNELESFKSFQEQLKASVLEVPPKPESLSFISSSRDIFNP